MVKTWNRKNKYSQWHDFSSLHVKSSKYCAKPKKFSADARLCVYDIYKLVSINKLYTEFLPAKRLNDNGVSACLPMDNAVLCSTLAC